ncbi:MAG TPA: hypothetical protein VG028_04115 [Terriglobia bacterium]|nr:hypothetical protein [Terriglobia bacterium]
MNRKHGNGVASSAIWRSAMLEDRRERAERLLLPSGAVILAVKPEPLDWILSGRIPQQLLGVALQSSAGARQDSDAAMTREEILDLAGFARQLVKASVVKPAIGNAPGEIALDDIPVKDRAYIFEWACRALRQEAGVGGRESGVGKKPSSSPTPHSRLPTPDPAAQQEGLSSEKLERFRPE